MDHIKKNKNSFYKRCQKITKIDKIQLLELYFLGQSVRINENNEYTVNHFPIEAYIRINENLTKGIFTIIVMCGNEYRLAGDRYADLATILRRTYFTAVFMQDHPEVIKWIEYRSARRSDIFREEILEIKRREELWR